MYYHFLFNALHHMCHCMSLIQGIQPLVDNIMQYVVHVLQMVCTCYAVILVKSIMSNLTGRRINDMIIILLNNA